MLFYMKKSLLYPKTVQEAVIDRGSTLIYHFVPFAPGRTFPRPSLPGLTASDPRSLMGLLCGTLSVHSDIPFEDILPLYRGSCQVRPQENISPILYFFLIICNCIVTLLTIDVIPFIIISRNKMKAR